MELMKFAEDKSLLVKREYLRTSRGRNNIQKGAIVVSNILDAIARVNRGTVGGNVVCETDESGGALRMKIKVKKEDVKQVLEAMRSDDVQRIIHRHPPPASSLSSSFEQRLFVLRKRQLLRSTQIKIMRQRSSSWTPALQSIPEEF